MVKSCQTRGGAPDCLSAMGSSQKIHLSLYCGHRIHCYRLCRAFVGDFSLYRDSLDRQSDQVPWSEPPYDDVGRLFLLSYLKRLWSGNLFFHGCRTHFKPFRKVRSNELNHVLLRPSWGERVIGALKDL